MLVIFVFLRNARATLIPSLSVPLSLVGTLGAMYLFGFSLNNLSLMALTIATGFVVDDAIVVIENISRYIEEGEQPLQAALKGSEQIGFTIISLTVSLIAVLIPLLFMGDVVGRLFREFAITLSVTILISAVVSLTLVPMACAKLLKPETEAHENAFQRYSREGFDKIIELYGHALNWVLDRQTFVLLIALGTFALTAYLYIIIPKGFFPLQDTGVIQAISEAPQSVSYAAMAERQQQLASVILKDPDVDSLSSFIGVDGTNTTLNSGRILINLKPYDERKSGITAVMQRIKDVDGIADRHHPLHAAGAGPDHRRHRQPHAIPVHPAGRRSGATGRMDAETGRQAQSACRSSPTSPATSRPTGSRSLCRSTATRPPASASRRPPSTTRCTIPTASASSRPSSPTRTSTASSSRPIRACRPRWTRCSRSICRPRSAARRCRWR